MATDDIVSGPHRAPPASTPASDDRAKRRALARMKLVSTGLLLVATVLYLLFRWLESRHVGEWVGYVQATAEAGMVGALADWFAVTALFRHPLGLPIPHTALIRQKKQQLGASLAGFVGTNFLAPEVITDKLESVDIPLRMGQWLAVEEHAARVAAESSTVLGALVGVLRDEDVQQVIDNTIVRRIAEPLWGPPIGTVLAELLAQDRHAPLLDLLAERAYQWANDSQDTIDKIVLAQAPSWSPKFVDIMLSERIHAELVEFTWNVRSTPDHELRRAATRFLVEFARDLQDDEATIAKAERVKAEIMGRAEITGLAAAGWQVAKRLILESADDPDSTLRRKVTDSLVNLGERLNRDETLRARCNAWLRNIARYVTLHYTHEITAIISDTVAHWDAEETSRKIELQVGRDLQFIRINGTVIGSLAGLLIYTVSHLLFGIR